MYPRSRGYFWLGRCFVEYQIPEASCFCELVKKEDNCGYIFLVVVF